MLRILRLILALVLGLTIGSLIAVGVKASHGNEYVSVYDTPSGSGVQCLGVRGARSSLNGLCYDYGVLQNFDNRTSSYRFSGEWNRCIVFYSGASYSGSTWVAFGHDWGGLVTFPAWIDNQVSSFRFGYRYMPYWGTSYCAGPWS
jgi:hypothetical protein